MPTANDNGPHCGPDDDDSGDHRLAWVVTFVRKTKQQKAEALIVGKISRKCARRRQCLKFSMIAQRVILEFLSALLT